MGTVPATAHGIRQEMRPGCKVSPTDRNMMEPSTFCILPVAAERRSSEASYEAPDTAIELASHFHAELCLAHVVLPMPATVADPTFLAHGAEGYAKERGADAEKRWDTVSRRNLRYGVLSALVMPRLKSCSSPRPKPWTLLLSQSEAPLNPPPLYDGAKHEVAPGPCVRQRRWCGWRGGRYFASQPKDES